MNNKHLSFVMVVMLILNSSTVFANDSQYINSSSYTTILQVEVREDAEVLTLEDAVAKAIKNSSALKNAIRSLEVTEDQKTEKSELYTYSTDENSDTFLEIMKLTADYNNSLLSKDIQEKSIQNSMKKLYTSIINAEREVALLKLGLENDSKDLVVAEVKAKQGTVSAQELVNQELDVEKNKAELEKKEKSIEENYISLNSLLGAEATKKYQLSLLPEYEELELTGDIEYYVNKAISINSYIEQKINAVELAEKQLALNTSDSLSTETSLKNSVSTASLSLKDAKTDLDTKIRSCYNSVKTLELNYNNNLKELEVLKQNLSIKETKFDLNLITELELDKARYEIAALESTITSQIYEHMLLKDGFENTELL